MSETSTSQVIHLPGISRLCKTMRETDEPEVALLEGSPLPAYVSGIYLRTGPGLFDFEDFGSMKHLFDGYAMLSKLEIDTVNNTVSLTKKFLQSDSYKRALAASKPVIAEFATAPKSDPHQSFFSKVVHTLSPEFTDNNSSNITTIGRDVYTFGDTCYFREVDPVTLTCKERCDTNKLFNVHFQCAHPLTDPITGDLWNIGYSIYTGLKFNILKMSAGKSSQDMFKTSKIMASVHSRWSSSISSAHSFGMTTNYIVLIEQPFVVSVSKIAASILKKNAIYETMEWNAKEKNRFVLVHKSGRVQQIEYYSDKTFHYLHILNSYEDEENNQIVIDIKTYPSPIFLDALYVEKLRNDTLEISGELPQIQRFIIPILDDSTRIEEIPENVNLIQGTPDDSTARAVRQGNTIILTSEPIAEPGLDMAVVSPAVSHRKHEYFYAASILSQNSVRNKIYKINATTKRAIWWKQDDFTFLVGEPKFIPNPHRKDEEDGILLCPIIDLREEHQDFFLFLDRNMKEITRASFRQQLPIAFHGVFMEPRLSSSSSSGASSSSGKNENFTGVERKHGKRGEHSRFN